MSEKTIRSAVRLDRGKLLDLFRGYDTRNLSLIRQVATELIEGKVERQKDRARRA